MKVTAVPRVGRRAVWMKIAVVPRVGRRLIGMKIAIVLRAGRRSIGMKITVTLRAKRVANKMNAGLRSCAIEMKLSVVRRVVRKSTGMKVTAVSSRIRTNARVTWMNGVIVQMIVAAREAMERDPAVEEDILEERGAQKDPLEKDSPGENDTLPRLGTGTIIEALLASTMIIDVLTIIDVLMSLRAGKGAGDLIGAIITETGTVGVSEKEGTMREVTETDTVVVENDVLREWIIGADIPIGVVDLAAGRPVNCIECLGCFLIF
mmetsp:Transcript_15207/g.33011  ORF Transcript_15207/g.33011 Transcript_15207/m.33011 type:complete len:263 (-) Transcript_15207:58-846(-)